MKITSFLLSTFLFFQFSSFAQEDVISNPTPSLVDYEAFMKLVVEVEPHRKERLVSLSTFKQMSKEEDVIILDTRTKEMYDAKHVKGAIHLNFSAFTQENLEALIPNKSTKILIYCNNNFEDDQIYFPTKMYVPPTPKTFGITMALNIPTYINLYGYGYKNVYELAELISAFGNQIEFEGTSVQVGEVTE